MTSNVRAAGQASADFLAWVVAVPIALWLRFDFSVPPGGWSTALFWGIAAGVLHVTAGYIRKLYRGRYRFGSFDEVTGVVVAASIVTLVGEVGVLLLHPTDLPRTVPLLAGGLALGMMLAGRFSLRFWRERVRTPRDGDRTLVYGAGDGGSQLVRAMVANHGSGYCLVGLIDDDPRKRHLRISGVRVRGTICDLEKLVDLLDAQVLVVAIADVNAAQLRDLDKRCRALGRAPARHPQCGGDRERHRATVGRLRRHRGGPARPPPDPHRRARHRRRCSPASGCSSPAPAARSARSSPARCTATTPPSSACSTATSPPCTPCS